LLQDYDANRSNSVEWIDAVPPGKVCNYTIWLTSFDSSGSRVESDRLTQSYAVGEET